MITRVDLGATQLTNSNRYLQSASNLAFPDIMATIARKASFAGQKVQLGKPGGYKFAMDWLVTGSSFSDLASQRETFIKLLGQLIKDGSYTLKIYKSNSINVQIEIFSVGVSGSVDAKDGATSKVLVDFASEYPFLLSQTENSSDVLVFNGGGMAIPMGLPMDMSAGGSNEATLTSNGNVGAYPTLTFFGPLSNPSIQNVTTGKILSVNYSLASISDYLIIDTFKRTALLYSGSPSGINVRQYVSGDFWTLEPGNNLIHLGNSSVTSGKCTVKWRDHYLGI